MIEITFPVVIQIIQTVALIVAIIYYITIMRNQQRTRELTLESQVLTRKAQEQALETRQAQLFMSIYNRTNEIGFWNNYFEIMQWEWENFEEYHEKYRLRPEMREKFLSVGAFFEGVGVMVNRKLIDVTMVDDLISGPLMAFWQKFEPMIHEDRIRRNTPTMWEWFEYLYQEVKKVAETEHGEKYVDDFERLI